MKKIFLFLTLLFAFSSYTWAYTDASCNFWNWLNWFLDFLTAIWYILPILAGKLLTNDFVYGTFMHLDVILWKVWNFSRTVANFLIGFIFVFAIFKYLVFFNDKNVSVIKSYLPKLAIWTILVNASWFIIWALIDLSTILIVSFGSLASMITTDVYKKNTEKNFTITTDWIIKKWCDVSQRWCLWWFKIIENKKSDVSIRDILRYENSISGPLMFLWDSFFDINQVKTKIQNEWFSNDKYCNYSTGARMKFFLTLLVIVLFLVPMFILIIVNLVRIFRLRIYIWFSPLIFLDQLFWWKVLQKTNKAFSFSNMIWLIFQPALVVLAFSIWFVFIVVFLNIILWKETKYDAGFKKLLQVQQIDNWKVIAKTFMMQDETADYSKYRWWFFGFLLWAFLIIWIVWSLLKLSFKATEITSKISDWVYSFAEDVLKSAPVIPTPFGFQSVGSLKQLWTTIQGLPSKRAWEQAGKLEKIFDTVIDASESDLQDYENVLKKIDASMTSNTLSELDKEEIDKMFDYLNKYSWKEIKILSNKNAKKLLSDIIAKLKSVNNSKNSARIRQILDRVDSYSSDDKKLEVILKNSDTIKQFLKWWDLKDVLN